MKICDIRTWDAILSEVDKSLIRNNIPEDKKKIVNAGYSEMKNLLGEDFLKKSSNSVVISIFSNFAPWALLKNADFGQKLRLLNGRTDFEDVKRDLVQDNFENSFGAEAEVEVAGDFVQKGLEIEIIERRKGKRTPDFRVKVNNKWIYFEITTFRTYSAELKEINQFWYKTFKRINQICQKHGRFVEVDFNGITVKDAKARVDDIECKILEMIQSTGESESMASQVKIMVLKKEEGYGPPYIQGIRITTDEIYAISRKLSEKIGMQQLPSGECSVLLIFTRSPFPPDFKFFIPSMSERLLESIKADPNLYAGVVQYICHDQLPFFITNDKFKITHRTEHDGIYNCYNIIIPNPNFKIEEWTSDFLENVL